MAFTIDRYRHNSFDTGRINFPLTVPDNTVNNQTSISLLGRGVTQYGERVAESLVHMMENFAGTTPPANPLTGQLWWKQDPASITAEQVLLVYNGTEWKNVSGAKTYTTTVSLPATGNAIGDVVWDSQVSKFKIWDGTTWNLLQIGQEKPTNPGPVAPPSIDRFDGMLWYDTTTDTLKIWDTNAWKNILISEPILVPTINTTLNPIKLNSGKEIIIFKVDGKILYVLTGNDATNAELVFTKPDSTLDTSLQLLFPTGLKTGLNAAGGTVNATFAAGGTNQVFGTWSLGAGASWEATYSADIGERYKTDKPLEKGTVVILGGSEEITTTTTEGDDRVFGVLSTEPAYKLNSGAGDDATHPYVAMVGRVPCKVVGQIRKGDRLVTASLEGHARTMRSGDSGFQVFARALENKTSEEPGIIEVTIIGG